MNDDDLRDRLRRADPAASLAPISHDEFTRLLETTMTITTARPARTPWRPLALAAAVLALVLAGYLLTRHPAPRATIAQQPAPLTLRLGADPVRKCVWPPDPRYLKDADVAFAGTATGVATGVVTIHVTRLFKGPATTEVRLRQMSDSEAITFTAGEHYLISASDGNVADCLSGPVSPELEHAYDEAF